MKKITTLMLAALALAVTSCQKDETISGKQSGEVDIAIKASLPQTIGTYAAKNAGSDKGGVNNVDPDSYDLRYIMEVWSTGDSPTMVCRKVMSVSDWSESSSVTFNARLLAKEYDFVFWADFVDAAGNTNAAGSEPADKHYTTTGGLNNVTFNGDYAIGDDSRDAYYGKQTVDLTNQGATIGGITLSRPFGKLRLIATDVPENTGTNTPETITIHYGENTFYKAFNALGGAVCGDRSQHSETLSCTAEAEEGTYLLAYDYILAADDATSLSGVTVDITVNGQTITKKLPTIPVAANKLTTVKGNFYTNEGTLSVNVEDAFSATEIVNVPVERKVSSITNASTAITEAAAAPSNTGRAVKVIVESSSTSVAIPSSVSAENTPEIILDLSTSGIASGQTLTIGDNTGGSETDFAGTISVVVPAENVGNLDIKAPNAHVVINGKYTNVTAKTSSSTLVIEKGTVIENLIVEAGNVEIYGEVNSIAFNNDASKITVYGVAAADALKAAAKQVEAGKCKKILLTDNIDLQGSEQNIWEPIDTEGKNFEEFDGNGYTISNLYVDNYSGKTDVAGNNYGGLFYVLQGTVKNLTIDQATVTCFRGGALVGRMDCGLLENCKIKDVTITGYQKVGGLVGFINTSAQNLTIRGCSVAGCTIKSTAPDEGLYQAGGLIGYVMSDARNILIEGNSVNGISFGKVYESTVVDKVHDMEQLYSHAFIGDLVNLTANKDNYDTYTVELRNNTVAQQISGIPTCDRTDNYIGWWPGYYNAGKMYTTKLVVDGIVKDRWIEVKRLAAQIAEGGEVKITRNYDLSALEGAVEITKPTTITLGAGIIISSDQESTQILNNSKLTINADATAAVNFVKRIVENYGELTVTGGKYTTASHESGTTFWNNAEAAVLTLNNVNVEAGMFAVAGSGKIDINGGTIKSTSSNKYGNWAYCIRAQGGGTMTIDDATVEGVQGCIASIEGSHVTVKNATVSARNSDPQHQDAFYALYAASDADLEVISGEFYSDRTPCCLASNDDNPSNPYGGFILKGGKYSSLPINDGVSPAQTWEPEDGYKYVEITAGGDFKWEIVAQ